jgi:uncharacterized protein (DUF1330 family)
MAEPAMDPDAEQFAKLTSSTDEGPIVMVNLLRYKEEADGVDAGVSGREAYGRYGVAVAPLLAGVGGKILVAVDTVDSIIGPEAAEWDTTILVQYPSRQAFLDMVTDPEYLKITVHRTNALADSRLILSNLVYAAGS